MPGLVTLGVGAFFGAISAVVVVFISVGAGASGGTALQYAATRDAAFRERIIIQYAPLVKYVVGRLAINLPTIVDSDDILSYGTIGLMDAIERFDSTRGIKFETYAISRIRGAIIDGL